MIFNIYKAAWLLVGPFAPLFWQKRMRRGKEVEGRQGERFGLESPAIIDAEQSLVSQPWDTGDRPVIWFHAASNGELISLYPLIDQMLVEYPDFHLLCTTNTRTSYDLFLKFANELSPHEKGNSPIIRAERLHHRFVPWDHPQWVARFLKRWRPQLGIFAEKEIWPCLIDACKHQKIPLFLVNAQLSDKSYRHWQRLGRAGKAFFEGFTRIFAVDEGEAAKFEKLGAKSVETLGNLKWIGAKLPVNDIVLKSWQQAFAGTQIMLIANSHENEEAPLAKIALSLLKDNDNLCIFWAPRHTSRVPAIKTLMEEGGQGCFLRSDFANQGIEERVLLIDKYGEMGLAYRLSDIVVSAGSFDAAYKGHNPLEAARLDKPQIIGPYHISAKQAVDKLAAAGGLIITADYNQLAKTIALWLDKPEKRAKIAKNAGKVFLHIDGAAMLKRLSHAIHSIIKN